jgi:hypothetical protein
MKPLRDVRVIHPARFMRVPRTRACAGGLRRAKEENVMLQTEIHDYARKLLQVRGPDAIAEAAQKAITFEKEGKAEDAKNWRHIADAMKQMRGPHQS